MNQIDAAENPALAEQMINTIMADVETSAPQSETVSVTLEEPEDLVFELPGGYLNFQGDVLQEAEVRELTGRDEEALSRLKASEKILQEILQRGVVRVGNAKPDEEVLDGLLSGDRDYLLLRIFVATFGRTLTARPFCPRCQQIHEEDIDLLRDVEVRKLSSPYDRRFTVEISKGEVVVDLPTGVVQRKMISAIDRSVAELSSVLLENTVAQINGVPILSPGQVLDLPIRDRRTISEAIIERNPGPQMQDIEVTCECGMELEVPLSLAALFQFS
jgi:hypothetical protein